MAPYTFIAALHRPSTQQHQNAPLHYTCRVGEHRRCPVLPVLSPFINHRRIRHDKCYVYARLPTPPQQQQHQHKYQQPRQKQQQQQQDPPPPLSLRDTIDLWVENILVLYGDRPPRDTAPIAEGNPSDLTSDVPFFISLHRAFLATGPIYKLAFGPKVFIVVQDPVIARSVLRENPILYEKGILAEILEEIMGSGLIPADYETWKIRRRAITPAFHVKWLSFLTSIFAKCTLKLCSKLDRLGGDVVDMETEYNSLALDVVGLSVFNYDFDSVTAESPVIKAVLRILKETEHRSTVFLPYWKIPGAKMIVPRLRAFYNDMDTINNTLNNLIRAAKMSATPLDLADLQARDYDKVSDPSLLRFLVELRGEQTTNKQLRDDLMTLLIAGHETVASVMTWATVELAKNPHIVQRAREEIDVVLGDRVPTFGDVQRLSYLRLILAETLRLYPAPPILIRRLLADTELPKGSSHSSTPLKRGTDVFINVYSLHRSSDLWDDPDRFDPDRWLRPKSNPGVEGWAGYNPATGLLSGNPLYPTELNADFAFLPFGGGSRKCVGDVFAILESAVALAMIIRRFDFEFADPSQEVPMTTGATIHTKHGLNMHMKKRHNMEAASPASASKDTAAVPVGSVSLAMDNRDDVPT